jgi:3-hydroxymyristoyl/3-hydroxydecanoyl-(acyl carrier protein) dehydratase
MSDLTETGPGELRACFLFPAEFAGFQGHFPGRPILPAVCEIQAALAMLEAWKGEPVALREIILAKFATPVTCDEEVVCQCAVTLEGGPDALVRSTVATAAGNVARFRLRVSFQEKGRGVD